ncbi:hypothetical protein BDP27DRAFT_1365265 [Rhodocollybia butyracea]|uniref:Uncharacterized protein n=1 Tax=Rhodocollybia butyracea TaxID=206335 RepID=A0A9P5PP88_9AGAR|nr:hypothetical protein BDP27DRAFT_1365265 [Rhodocollybia butyracea]
MDLSTSGCNLVVLHAVGASTCGCLHWIKTTWLHPPWMKIVMVPSSDGCIPKVNDFSTIVELVEKLYKLLPNILIILCDDYLQVINFWGPSMMDPPTMDASYLILNWVDGSKGGSIPGFQA